VQVLMQVSSPRFLRWIDRLQILAQFAVLQGIDWPDGSSTVTGLPRLQHATKLQTSSNPSLDTVPGGFAHKSLSVVNVIHVDKVSGCAAPGVVIRLRKKIIRTVMMSICLRRRKGVDFAIRLELLRPRKNAIITPLGSPPRRPYCRLRQGWPNSKVSTTKLVKSIAAPNALTFSF
jgi:hypothetical protein